MKRDALTVNVMIYGHMLKEALTVCDINHSGDAARCVVSVCETLYGSVRG